MFFSTGNNVVDVDVIMTGELYYSALSVLQRCNCPVCRNFTEALEALDKKKLRFLTELGISPEKCTEIWPYSPSEKEGYQKHYLKYPLYCSIISYDGENEEWYKVSDSVSLAISKEKNGVYLLVDWDLEWKHK